MSDGSANLVWRDPATFEIVRTVAVTSYGAPQPRLNELECVGETVYANVWREDVIVAIEARTGVVVARVDAGALKEQLTAEERRSADVLNGIAYRPETGRFFLTGKRWPKLFEVEFVE